MWKSYGTVAVLVDCSVRMRRGEVVVVCGPSGSGKSTLIKTINGQKPFQKGEITVNGVSVGDPATNLPKLRSRVGMVFQNFELFPHMGHQGRHLRPAEGLEAGAGRCA